jgi:hypothetical protein
VNPELHTQEDTTSGPPQPGDEDQPAERLIKLDIKDLHRRGILDAGFRRRPYEVTPDLRLTVFESGGKVVLAVLAEQHESFVQLESRPLGNGLTWYFRNIQTGRLSRTVYIKGGQVCDRKSAGIAYPSQYLNKTLRSIRRLPLLWSAIFGDLNIPRGPARGMSRMRKLAELRSTLLALRRPSWEKEQVLEQYPECVQIIRYAKRVLKIELASLPPDWDRFLKDDEQPAKRINTVRRSSNEMSATEFTRSLSPKKKADTKRLRPLSGRRA